MIIICCCITVSMITEAYKSIETHFIPSFESARVLLLSNRVQVFTLAAPSFPPSFPFSFFFFFFLFLASSAICLPDCLEFNWNIVQRYCLRLSQSSFKNKKQKQKHCLLCRAWTSCPKSGEVHQNGLKIAPWQKAYCRARHIASTSQSDSSSIFQSGALLNGKKTNFNAFVEMLHQRLFGYSPIREFGTPLWRATYREEKRLLELHLYCRERGNRMGRDWVCLYIYIYPKIIFPKIDTRTPNREDDWPSTVC